MRQSDSKQGQVLSAPGDPKPRDVHRLTSWETTNLLSVLVAHAVAPAVGAQRESGAQPLDLVFDGAESDLLRTVPLQGMVNVELSAAPFSAVVTAPTDFDIL